MRAIGVVRFDSPSPAPTARPPARGRGDVGELDRQNRTAASMPHMRGGVMLALVVPSTDVLMLLRPLT